MFQKWQQCMEIARKAIEQENWEEAEKQLALGVSEAERFGYNNTRLLETLAKQAEVFVAVGKTNEAVDSYERALAMAKNAYGPFHHEVGAILTGLGKLYILYNVEEAEKNLNQAISVYKELKDEREVLPIEQLANLLGMYGRQDEAETLLRLTLDRLERNPPVDQSLLGRILLALGNMCMSSEDEEEAAILLARAFPILKDDPECCEHAVNAASVLGKHFFGREQFDEAEDAYDEAIVLAAGRPQACARYAAEALVRLSRLQTVVRQNYQLAEELLVQAMDACETAVPPLSVGLVRSEYARLATRTGKYSRVEALDKLLFDNYKTVLGQSFNSDPAYGYELLAISQGQQLAELLCKQRKYKDAEEYSRWVVKTSERYCGPTSLYSLQSAITLATICSETAQIKEASEICEKLLNQDENEQIDCLLLVKLIPLLASIGQREDAEALLIDVQERVENAALDGIRDYNASAYFRLALANKKLGKIEDSKHLMEIAIRELEGETGVDSIFLAFVLEDWADELNDLSENELAVALTIKATEIRAKH